VLLHQIGNCGLDKVVLPPEQREHDLIGDRVWGGDWDEGAKDSAEVVYHFGVGEGLSVTEDRLRCSYCEVLGARSLNSACPWQRIRVETPWGRSSGLIGASREQQEKVIQGAKRPMSLRALSLGQECLGRQECQVPSFEASNANGYKSVVDYHDSEGPQI